MPKFILINGCGISLQSKNWYNFFILCKFSITDDTKSKNIKNTIIIKDATKRGEDFIELDWEKLQAQLPNKIETPAGQT